MTPDETQLAELLHAAAPWSDGVDVGDVARRVRHRRTRVRASVTLVGIAVATLVAATSVLRPSGHRPEPTHPAPSPAVDVTGAVPWGDQAARTYQRPPRTPVPRPPTDARPCTASDVSARIAEVSDGAGGHYFTQVTFRNTGTTTCLLKGYPTFVIASEPGLPTVRGIDGSWFPTYGTANMAPGKETYLGVETDEECDARPAGGPAGPLYHHVAVGLPGGGSVTVDRASGLDLTCGLRLTEFSVPRRRERSTVDPLSRLQAAMTLPPTAAAGHDLTFVVTLTNPTDDPISLSRCPSYVETLSTPTAKGKAGFTLNCAPGAIEPHEAVRFEMRLPVPAAATGPCQVWWSLAVPDAADARGVTTIVGGR